MLNDHFKASYQPITLDLIASSLSKLPKRDQNIVKNLFGCMERTTIDGGSSSRSSSSTHKKAKAKSPVKTKAYAARKRREEEEKKDPTAMLEALKRTWDKDVRVGDKKKKKKPETKKKKKKRKTPDEKRAWKARRDEILLRFDEEGSDSAVPMEYLGFLFFC